MNSSKYLKYSQYSKQALLVLNVFAVFFHVFVLLFASKYIIAKDMSHLLLERLDVLPAAPNQVFWTSLFAFSAFLLVRFYRDYQLSKERNLVNDWLLLAEIIFLIWTFFALQFSYNGLFLLVFADIFYSYTNVYSLREQKYWLVFVIMSFALLLLSHHDLLSTVVNLPSLDVYINFFPQASQLTILFVKNFLTSFNIIIFIISLVTYVMYSVVETHKIEEELRMADRANSELNAYISLAEKIAQDKERKRIAREIHDTLGHALTGISAGIDAVAVLIDLNPSHAKKQLSNVSKVVRGGIQDVRRSLEKLRPGALDKASLKEALIKMIKDYEDLSKLAISFSYEWSDADFDVTTEDIIFRIIQESITNSLRHGHASQVLIKLWQDQAYHLSISDDGQGCSELTLGYGLTQMRERLAIIGGQVAFAGQDGFETKVTIPLRKGDKG